MLSSKCLLSNSQRVPSNINQANRSSLINRSPSENLRNSGSHIKSQVVSRKVGSKAASNSNSPTKSSSNRHSDTREGNSQQISKAGNSSSKGSRHNSDRIQILLANLKTHSSKEASNSSKLQFRKHRMSWTHNRSVLRFRLPPVALINSMQANLRKSLRLDLTCQKYRSHHHKDSWVIKANLSGVLINRKGLNISHSLRCLKGMFLGS